MDLARLYDNRAAVPEHPSIIAGWARDAAGFRASHPVELDQVYGARPRNRFDVIQAPGGAARPLIVFIHGGYWRSLEKSSFTHMAAGPLAHGFSVAIPGYTLCPEVTLPDIIDEMRQCCLHLWRQYGRPLIVVGHSAGGHLAASMAATDWTQFGQPRDMVRAVFPVSGIFDLRPLLATPINADLRLSPEQAVIASPLLWPVNHRFAAAIWAGSIETAEFRRQSATLAAAWSGLGLDVTWNEVEGADHFSIAAELSSPHSPMTQSLVSLAGALA